MIYISLKDLNVNKLLLITYSCFFCFGLNSLDIDKSKIDKIDILFTSSYNNGKEYHVSLLGHDKDDLIYIINNNSEITESLVLMQLEEGSYTLSMISGDKIQNVFSIELLDTLYFKEKEIFFENLYITSFLRLQIMKLFLTQ